VLDLPRSGGRPSRVARRARRSGACPVRACAKRTRTLNHLCYFFPLFSLLSVLLSLAAVALLLLLRMLLLLLLCE